MNECNSHRRRRWPAGSAPALFEHASKPMAAIAVAEDPRIEAVNRAYRERFSGVAHAGADEDRFLRWTRLCEAERALVRHALAGEASQDLVDKTVADGRRTFEVAAIPAEHDDLAAYLTYRDVTTDLIRDQQLAVLRRVLRHDLRNDLTVLLGYAETIADTADDPAIADRAATMVEAAVDLRSVATAAGRMQCVTSSGASTSLGDAIAKARRTLTEDVDADVTIDGTVPPRSADRRIAIALEELGATLAAHGAETASIGVDAADDWCTITIATDATLDEQDRTALEGREETKLRHANGISPWIVRWAVRAAGGRLHVESATDGCTVVVTAPVLEAGLQSGGEHESRPEVSHQADD